MFTKPIHTIAAKLQSLIQPQPQLQTLKTKAKADKNYNPRLEIQQKIDDMVNQSYNQDQGYKIMNGPSNVKIWIDGPYGCPA